MAINLPRIVPGLTGAPGIDNGTTGSEKINEFLEEVETLYNDIAPNAMEDDGENSDIDAILFDPNTLSVLSEIGDVRYSSVANTIEFQTKYGPMQLGQMKQIIAKNDQGSSVGSAKVMYISGAVGNVPFAKLASASDKFSAYKSIGVTVTPVIQNGFVALTTEGRVRNINTSAFAEGAMLWLGLNGNITTVEPVAPTPKISIGMVIRSHATVGQIYVKTRLVNELSESSSVNVSDILDKDLLKWNSVTDRFENSNIQLSLSQIASLTGDESLSGTKTFASSPIVPAPQLEYDAANKQHVDTGDAFNKVLLDIYRSDVEKLKVDDDGFLIAYIPDLSIDPTSVDENGNLIITIQ